MRAGRNENGRGRLCRPLPGTPGGDFADYHLMPDCTRALMAGETVPLRDLESIRPWQHVLEPVSGYLWLASRLLQEGPTFVEAWTSARMTDAA
jgi:hypothetical protein